jgi:AcrR family transcriptional regulator
LLPFYINENDPPAKREILRAALTPCAERGLAATSIRDIAEESGYTNPALYRHFASMGELELHLFETCHARVWRVCADALASQNGFAPRLDAYVAAWLGLFDDEPAAWMVIQLGFCRGALADVSRAPAGPGIAPPGSGWLQPPSLRRWRSCSPARIGGRCGRSPSAAASRPRDTRSSDRT